MDLSRSGGMDHSSCFHVVVAECLLLVFPCKFEACIVGQGFRHEDESHTANQHGQAQRTTQDV